MLRLKPPQCNPALGAPILRLACLTLKPEPSSRRSIQVECSFVKFSYNSRNHFVFNPFQTIFPFFSPIPSFSLTRDYPSFIMFFRSGADRLVECSGLTEALWYRYNTTALESTLNTCINATSVDSNGLTRGLSSLESTLTEARGDGTAVPAIRGIKSLGVATESLLPNLSGRPPLSTGNL
jgi:hypothetical protein